MADELKASPTYPGQEFLGALGRVAEKLGISLQEANQIVSQQSNSPIKAFLTNMLLADPLRSAGTALQDWTGTPREISEEYPYRRLVSGKGMTMQIDPRVLDFGQFAAPIAAPIVSRAKAVAQGLPQAVREAAMAAYGPATAPKAIVWHGSPHRFPATEKSPLGQFDPTKIGTGEGAQAYGHGHYLAEAKDVAKSYWPRSPKYEEKLMRKYNAAQAAERYPEMEVLEDAMLHNSPDDIVARFTNPEVGYSPEHAKAAKDFAKWYQKNPPEVGGLYKVDLPDEQIAKMLDWDKPLSQQPLSLKPLLSDIENFGAYAADKVRNLASQPGLEDWAKRDLLSEASQLAQSKSPQHVAGVLKRMQLYYGISPDSGPFKNVASDFLGFVKGMQSVPNMDTGGGAVSYLQARYGEKAASEILRNAGIPGIRYLDQGSRVAGEGTRNFVVFPGGEDILNIVGREKNGGQVSADAMRMKAWDKQVQKKSAGGISKALLKGAKVLAGAGKSAEELAAIEKAVVPTGMPAQIPQGKVPLIFERAPAKSKEEIRAIAERMAPQVLGEFVKKPGDTKSVAGKSKKVFERQKELPVDIVPTKELPPSQPVGYENLAGNVVIGVPGDPSEANKILRGIGDVQLEQGVPLHGGPRYGMGRPEFWASDYAAASGLQSLGRRASAAYDAPVVGSYIKMPEGLDYAMHNLDALLSIQQPEKLSPGKIAQLNNVIKRGSLKYGKFPDFVGFEDPDLVLLQSQINPRLRKQISETLSMPTYTEKFGLFSGQDIQNAITVPELRDVEAGVTGFSIGRMAPNAPLTESMHPTYAKDIPGEYMGHTKYPIPYELSYPDVTKFAAEQAPLKGANLFNMFKMSGPRQIVDQQLIDEIKQYEEMMKSLTGKKKGGKVAKKADGGLTSDDLILEERKL